MPEIRTVAPPYLQVVRYLAEKIARGDLAPGDRLPSERELRDEWGISKVTANKALAQLKAEGLVETRVGVGALVRQPLSGPRPLWERIVSHGSIYLPNERSERTTGRVGADQAPHVVRESLTATTASELLFRRRIIYRDDVPSSVCTSWYLPATLDPVSSKIVDRLQQADSITEGSPRFIADVLGRDLDEAIDHVDAVAATEAVSTDLQVPLGSPILRIISTVFVEGAWPIESGEYWMPAEAGATYRYRL